MSENVDHKKFILDSCRDLLDDAETLREQGDEKKADEVFLGVLKSIQMMCCSQPDGPVMLPNGSVYWPMKLTSYLGLD